MIDIIKYPRTYHLEGSKFQTGDFDLDAIPFEEIRGSYVVVEEKMDGANAGISFSDDQELLLQSRGHYLTGGYRERHFELFKSWAHTYRDRLYALLGSEYLMFGEWLYAKHTVFYDQLPHYLMEFDVYHKPTGTFLSTSERERMLAPCRDIICSVAVLWKGQAEDKTQITDLLDQSLFMSPSRLNTLRTKAINQGLNAEQVLHETDQSDLMEGLYLKKEMDQEVLGRYKYVRGDFLTTVLNSQSHWLNRPIIPNELAPGVSIFPS